MRRSGVRVLVADDHPMFRMGLAVALRSLGFECVDEATDGQHVVELARGRAYDVVILDLRMPRLTGVDAARAITSVSLGARQPRVIMLSTFDEPAVVRAAAEAGASAFFGKETEPSELASAIDRLMSSEQATLLPAIELPALTEREMTVMDCLVRGDTVKQIARQLELSAETVKDHVARLYDKLGVNDRVGLVRAAREYGWLMLRELDVRSP